MNPQEEGAVGNLAEPGECVLDDVSSAALDSFVTIGSVAAKMKVGVVNVESAVESGRGAIERIENERTDEGSGVISVLMEEVGQIGKFGREWNAEVGDVIELGISAGEDCGMGCGRNRNVRIGLGKDDSLFRHCVKIGSEAPG